MRLRKPNCRSEGSGWRRPPPLHEGLATTAAAAATAAAPASSSSSTAESNTACWLQRVVRFALC